MDKKKQEEYYLSDLSVVLNSEQGRRVLWEILAKCGVFRLSYSADANHTAFCEGKRDVGLNLLADILHVAPDKYTEMVRVAKHEFENRKV